MQQNICLKWVLVVLFALGLVGSGFAVTRTWDGGGADNLASNALNWSDDVAPVANDDVVFSNSSVKNCTWNIDITLSSWDQQSEYSGTVTVNTVYSSSGFDTLAITGNMNVNGGALTHASNTTTEANHLCVRVSGNLTVGASGTISATGQGFTQDYGTGAPSGQGAGGSYGGTGGWHGTATLGPTYGSPFFPVNLGSGGDEQSGGGAIFMNVGNATSIAGSIVCHGGNSVYGTGAGGSIYIKTKTITGVGTIAANGGATSPGWSTGSGGRVAIVLTQAGATFDGLTQPNAYGGAAEEGNDDMEGAAGTVYLETAADGAGNGQLIIDNRDTRTAGRITTKIPPAQSWTIKKLKMANYGILDAPAGTTLDISNCTFTGDVTDRFEGIRMSGGNIVYPSGTFTIDDWSLLADKPDTINAAVVIASAGYITHTRNDYASVDTYKVDLRIAGNLTLQSGGQVNVTSKGFGPWNGPGKPLSGSNGGSYGGMGGPTLANSGLCYGSVTAPTSLGSGGSENNQSELYGNAGGAIKLVVTGTVSLGDSISANGDKMNCYSGSGGSVFIKAAAITGAGYIAANGGITGGACGSGGGGRVSLVLTQTGNTFAGLTNTPQAFTGIDGDANAHARGAAGTVYMETADDGAGNGLLVIDDNNTSTVTSGIVTAIPASGTWTAKSVTVKKYAVLKIPAATTLTIAGTGAGLLNINSANAVVTNEGTLTVGGTSITNSGTFTSTVSTSTVTYTGQSNDAAVFILNTAYNKLCVNNAGTTFSLPAANLTVTDSVKILAGTLSQTSGALTAGGIVVSGGANFSNMSNGALTLGSTGIVNNGTFTLAGNPVSPPSIVIRSSSLGSQRSWSGSGTFGITSVDIQDQGTMLALTTYTSRDKGNNTGFTFTNPYPSVSVSPHSLLLGMPPSSDSFVAIGRGTNPSYEWRKVSDNSIVGTTANLVFTNPSIADSGSIYRCILTSGVIKDTSALCTLFVTKKPWVKINQRAGQLDPAKDLPLLFDVVFAENVRGFGDVIQDVNWGGGTTPTAWTVTAIGDSAHYILSVTVSGNGSVVPSIPGGSATSQSQNAPNLVSTSTDNSVNYDNISAASTILTPVSGSAFRPTTWIDSIKGISNDAVGGSGVDSVLIMVKNSSQNRYLTRTNTWSIDPTWCKATFTAPNWFLRIDPTVLTAGGYGVYQDSVRAYDKAGNIEAPNPLASNSFTFDNTAPTGSISLLNSSGYINTSTIKCQFTRSAIDSIRADSMRVDTAASSTKSFIAYADTQTINIAGTGVNGKKRVYAWFKDRAGNLSPRYADSTVYDNVLPASVVTTTGLHNSTSWSDTIRGTASDATSKVKSVRVQIVQLNNTSYWKDTSFQTGSAASVIATGTTAWFYRIPDAKLPDGPYTINAWATDSAGNEQTAAGSGSFTYKGTGTAGGGLTILATGGFTRDSLLSLTVIEPTGGVKEMRIGVTPAGAGTPDTATAVFKPFATSDVSINVAGTSKTDHPFTVWVQYKDSANNLSSWISASATYDVTAPVTIMSTNLTYNKASWPLSGLQGTAIDATSGVSAVLISIRRPLLNTYWTTDGKFNGATETFVPANYTALPNNTWAFNIPVDSLPDGRYVVRVKARDLVGNEKLIPDSSAFKIDKTAPSASVQLFDRSGFTNVTKLGLQIPTIADSFHVGLNTDTINKPWRKTPATGIDSMDILAGGDGRKIVWVQFKDTVDNRTAWVSDTTLLDRVAPFSEIQTKGDKNQTSYLDTIRGTASDSLSGIDTVKITVRNKLTGQYWNGLNWGTTATTVTGRLTGSVWSITLAKASLVEGVYYITSTSVDNAGNNQTTPKVDSMNYYMPPVAKFGSGQQIVLPTGQSQIFSDSSTGTITNWHWTFGDGSTPVDQVVRANVSHAWSDTGKYTVTLQVDGPGGSNLLPRTNYVVVQSPDLNPITLASKYISKTAVQLTFRNCDKITTKTTGFLETVDSIKLFYAKTIIPNDAATGLFNTGYTAASLRSAPNGVFVDTVIVPELTSAFDSVYGFITVQNWVNRQPPLDPFNPTVNGCLALMKDTLRPINALQIRGDTSTWGAIYFYIDSVQTINATITKSVEIGYGSAANPLASISIPVDSVLAYAVAGRYTREIIDPIFKTEQDTLYISARILGRNNLSSARIANSELFVGRPRPVNSATLTTGTLDASTIVLTWTGTQGVDSIRMLRSTAGPFIASQYQFSPSPTLAIDNTILSTALGDTVTGLNPKQRYYFGMQVYKNGLWSTVGAAQATDSTPDVSTGSITNTAAFISAEFNNQTNTIKLIWRIAPASINKVKFAVTWALGIFPNSSNGPKTSWQSVTKLQDTTIIDMNVENFTFDTLYGLGIWLQSEANQSVAFPKDSSRGTVTITKPVWQKISYFTGTDPVYAFNHSVKFTRDNNYALGLHSARLGWQQPITTNGLVAVGPQFVFDSIGPSPVPFFVSLKVIDSLLPKSPSSFAPADARLYRIVNGVPVLQWNTAYDAAQQYVMDTITTFNAPFVLCIDTLPPRESILAQVKEVDGVADIPISVEIRDDVDSVRAVLVWAKGDELLNVNSAQARTFSLKQGLNTLTESISSMGALDNGLRIQLIINDGLNVKKVDLSVQGINIAANPASLRAMEWVPFHATNVISSPASFEKMMAKSSTDSAGWTYDTRYLRLFSWKPEGPANPEGGKWAEYASVGTDTIFTARPGRLFWAKTRDNTSINFGRGVTVSLSDTISMVLPPKSWTDFGIPFNFSMNLNDILVATGAQPKKKLQIYRWNAVPIAGGILARQAVPLYNFAVPTLSDSTLDLENTKLAGSTPYRVAYTVYNDSVGSVVLRIPPISKSNSAFLGKSMAASASGWWVTLLPKSCNAGLPSAVMCGFGDAGQQSARYWPCAPSFSSIRVGAYNRKNATISGIAILPKTPVNGWSSEMVFENSATVPERMVYSLAAQQSLPAGVVAAMYNPEDGTFADDTSELVVDIPASSRVHRWLVVGDAAYRENFIKSIPRFSLSFIGAWPNPFRHRLNIAYSISWKGARNVEFALFDIAGRVVWHQKLADCQPGKGVIVWNGKSNLKTPVATGAYFLRMTAVEKGTNSVKQFKQRLTYMP